MYNHFFGFKERPFKLVPNPDYLFLSTVHEEALAHLRYAAIKGDGFVEITGEVGTGKTMLCRAFLESIGPDVETAYIFNPRMDAHRLMQSICEEFGIDPEAEHTKALIDRLNKFLMEKKRNGKKVLLIIDEAQNLEIEVLEQLRLLSNLETTKDKLLQIILVGQPELGNILDSHELRQLGQRISLSCRLRPLTFAEARNYINHRISVSAGKISVRFTRSAIRQIHRFSGGIPRLINICCDRALLVAYGTERKKIGGRIASAALGELSSRGDMRKHAWLPSGTGIATAALVLAILATTVSYRVGFISPEDFRDLRKIGGELIPFSVSSARVADDTTGSKKTAIEDQAAKGSGHGGEKIAGAAAEPSRKTPPDLAASSHNKADNSTTGLSDYLRSGNENSRLNAANRLLSFWNINAGLTPPLDEIPTDRDFFALAALRHGFSIQRIEGDLKLLRKLNLPAILTLDVPGRTEPAYMVIKNADSRSMTLIDDIGREIVSEDREIASFWSGTAFVLWKDFLNLQGIIGPETSDPAVIALKLHLHEIGYENIPINNHYDAPTRKAIEDIQAKHGIHVDGRVGPMTKIVLYNSKPSWDVPRLTRGSNQQIPADGA